MEAHFCEAKNKFCVKKYQKYAILMMNDVILSKHFHS